MQLEKVYPYPAVKAKDTLKAAASAVRYTVEKTEKAVQHFDNIIESLEKQRTLFSKFSVKKNDKRLHPRRQ